MAKSKPYQYGRSPAPKTWQECADALKSIPSRKSTTLLDRLIAVEKRLKDKK